MRKILVSDIFGKTPSLEKLCKDTGVTKILDPYDGVYKAFTDEGEAYSYFTNYVGLEEYISIVYKEVTNGTSPCMLVCFSIGASVIWKLSEVFSENTVKRAVCFYGSQIRNASNLIPKFEIELIFPKHEQHFDVKN